MMKDGRPYTNENGWEDSELITDLPGSIQIIVSQWIDEAFVPIKSANKRYTSYGLKHLLERKTGIYLTNNQFKDAMLREGYEPVNPNDLNWTYRISNKSPVFKDI